MLTRARIGFDRRIHRFMKAAALPATFSGAVPFLRKAASRTTVTIIPVISIVLGIWNLLYTPRALLDPFDPNGIHVPYSQAYLDAVPALGDAAQCWAQRPKGQELQPPASAATSTWGAAYRTRWQRIASWAEPAPSLSEFSSYFLKAHFNQSKYKAPMLPS